MLYNAFQSARYIKIVLPVAAAAPHPTQGSLNSSNAASQTAS